MGLIISATRSCLLLGKSVKRAVEAGNYGKIMGNDFAGTVEELGPEVPEGVRIVGERVAGVITGSEFLSCFVHITCQVRTLYSFTTQWSLRRIPRGRR